VLNLNPWAAYEQYKQQLAAELPPSNPAWRAACRKLAETLRL
jgi:hypothetical protein